MHFVTDPTDVYHWPPYVVMMCGVWFCQEFIVRLTVGASPYARVFDPDGGVERPINNSSFAY